MAEDLIQIPGYEMKRELGEGGMARVFLATQLSLGREVAIKVLRKELAGGSEDFQKRFLHEGQMLAKLVHPNIVAIYDIASNDDVSYMAMEYLQGGTLTERVKQGLSVAEVLRITTQIAMALDLAHRNNIVHRDLKPSNIMFRDELTPVLTDFGIARKTDADHRLTKTGMVVGTPYYMSPEQITGKEIDGRSDIYSLGIMCYELLAGQLPFRADEPLALAMQHVQEPPPKLPEALADLQPVMDLLLAKQADERFQTMPEFVGAVKDLVLNDRAFAAKLSGETKIFDSEQFTDPAFISGKGRVSKVTGKVKSRRTGPRKPPSGGETAVLASGQHEARGRRGGWKIPAALAVLLLVLGGGGYVWYSSTDDWGGAEMSEEDRRLVDELLGRAANYLGVDQIEEPPGRNAVETLAQIFEIAPEHPDALRIAEQIAVKYQADAETALRSGDVAAASDAVARGLALAPGFDPLVALESEIAERRAAAERQARIEALIARGRAAEAAGRLFEPPGSNAYEAYQAVLELDAANQQASAGLNRMQDTLLRAAEQALAAGELDRASSIAVRARERFGNTSTIAAILQEVNETLRRQQEASQVASLLAGAERQIEAGQYVFPPGENALESYQAVLGLRPDSAEATQGLREIAAYFETEARAAFEAGDFAGSADYASRGLRALPDSESLLAIQDEATGRLDERARQIEQELQRAERLASEGQFLSGPGGGALAAYQRVLEESPGNVRATAALARLPDQVYTAAAQLQRDGNYMAASDLLSEATQSYPRDERFGALLADVEQQLDAQQRRLRLDQLMSEAERLVQVRPLTRASFEEAAAALKDILAQYPADVRVRAQLGELTSALAEEAERLSRQGNHDAAVRLVGFGLDEFEGNDVLLSARSTIAERRERQLEEERQRILAMTGQLAIDAKPWGEVVEIRDSAGNASELPPDATTPLVVSLLEGDYSVVVRGANGGERRELDVLVERQSLVQTRAEFGGMSADDYFEQSGW